MDEEQKKLAIEIAEKYHHSYAEFDEKATALEYSTLMKYVANEANRKQRVIAGLE